MRDNGWHNYPEKAIKREFAIADLYEEGYTVEEIADQVGITARSVQAKLAQMGLYDRLLTADYLRNIWPSWTAACDRLKGGRV